MTYTLQVYFPNSDSYRTVAVYRSESENYALHYAFSRLWNIARPLCDSLQVPAVLSICNEDTNERFDIMETATYYAIPFGNFAIKERCFFVHTEKELRDLALAGLLTQPWISGYTLYCKDTPIDRISQEDVTHIVDLTEKEV